MNFKQRKTLMKSFIEAQFGYCPLIWIFCGRAASNKINHIHERSLCIVYNDYISSFKDLLRREKTFTIHHRNIQSLAIELFKVKNNISNTIISELFETRSVNYNLRSESYFPVKCIKTSQYFHFSLNIYLIEATSQLEIAPECAKKGLILYIPPSRHLHVQSQ